MKKPIIHLIIFFIAIFIGLVGFSYSATADENWGPNEKDSIRWFNNILGTRLSGFVSGSLPYTPFYISQIVTYRIPYLLGTGKKLGGAYAEVVEQTGVGNCGDLAMYIAKHYPDSFNSKILVIRGNKNYFGKEWAHGANLVVPTDINGAPILVNGKIPSWNDIFSSDGRLNDLEKEAWKNALVLDAWKKKYTRFEDWAKSFDWVYINVTKIDGNYDPEEALKTAAYKHGCLLGRKVQTVNREDIKEIVGQEYAKWIEKENVVKQEFFRGYNECETPIDINFSIVFVVDASGSMSGSKLDAAKNAVRDTVAALKTDLGVEMALFVFSDCGSCSMLQGFTQDPNNIISKLNFGARGGTPIAYSLQKASNYLRQNGSGKRGKIILLSDGGESCSGNPVEAAKTICTTYKIFDIK
ncbi:MAG: vWA domain-containing protein [Candidatus Desulfaltia sp.]|nr:vWA domain-containing protein [Candidatus Desulfaltia sp.]